MVLVSRRGLLAGAAVGGGLLVAWALWPRDYGLPLAPAEGESAFNAWLKIGSDGIVTVAVPQLEMGQGVTTLLPQVIAVELGGGLATGGSRTGPAQRRLCQCPAGREMGAPVAARGDAGLRGNKIGRSRRPPFRRTHAVYGDRRRHVARSL